ARTSRTPSASPEFVVALAFSPRLTPYPLSLWIGEFFRGSLRDFSVSCSGILLHMCAVSNLKILLTRQQIAQRVKELGAEITRDFAGQTIIFVGVLKGAAIFLSDLAREVQLDSTFDFIGVSSYGNRPDPTHELQQ